MEKTFKGKVFKCGDDIDTDQIYHGQYLPLTDPREMAKHAMEFVPGLEDFVNQVKPGDVIVGGKNFGCGSSREHAVICLRENGISCVIAESFARIFYRNAVNLGLPLLECPGISKLAESGEEVEVNPSTGKIKSLSSEKEIQGHPISGLEREITEAGGLLQYVKKQSV